SARVSRAMTSWPPVPLSFTQVGVPRDRPVSRRRRTCFRELDVSRGRAGGHGGTGGRGGTRGRPGRAWVTARAARPCRRGSRRMCRPCGHVFLAPGVTPTTSPWAPLLCHLSDTGTCRTGASRPGPPPLADRAAPLPGEALSSLAALLAGLVEQQPAQPLRVVGGHRHRVSRRELGVAEVAAAGRVPASRVAAPHLPARKLPLDGRLQILEVAHQGRPFPEAGLLYTKVVLGPSGVKLSVSGPCPRG